ELASGTDHNGNVRVYPLPADGDYTQRDATPILSFGYDALTVVTDTVTLPADSTYIIEVDGGRYGIGGATGQYSLVINSQPAGDTGGDVYIAVESSDAVAVLDTASNSVTTNISVAQWPWAIGVAPDGSEVYTASRSDGSFTVIDAASSTVAATIGGVVNDPFDIAVSPDGAFVYVLDNNVGRVAIIDAAARAVSGELLGATRLPSALALDPSGDTAFVVAGDSVVAFDIATETPVDTLAGVFGLTADAAVTPDGTELVFTDFENNQLVIVDRASFSIAATVPEISEPRGMDLTGDGATAWIAARSSSTLVGVDLASRSFVAGISLPFQPYWVTVTPDGTIGYVTEGRGGTRLAVVDLVAGSVITTLTIGDGPAQIGIRP
ncbi:MAG: hypothetical protein R3314_13190, partial [Longimicrobiales bacterium]|nr:hypothetical protein [Longimicrobiales bacterium]